MRLFEDRRGSAVVETLFTFPMLLTAFMSFVQLAFLECGSLVTSHSAVESARVASVVLADDPAFWASPVGAARGKRLDAVLEAARIPIRATSEAPRVQVDVGARTTFREGDLVRVKVDYDFACTVPLGSLVCCGASRTRRLHAEATAPYQGAGYVYP